MLLHFIQKVATEMADDLSFSNRPRILIPAFTISVILNGQPQSVSGNACFYIPADSSCFCTDKTPVVCITFVDLTRHRLLQMADIWFRYQPRKELCVLPERGVTYTAFAEAVQGINAMRLPEMLDAAIQAIQTVTQTEGRMTIFQRIAFAGEMEELMGRAPNQTAASLALHFNMTSITLWRKCLATFGVNTRDFLVAWRYQRAHQLLLTTNHKVASITQAAGYVTAEHLMKLVKKNTGYTIQKWRCINRHIIADNKETRQN